MTDNYFEQLDRFLGPQEINRFIDGGQPKAPSGPITPISKLGATFAEKGPTGQQNVLTSLLSSIRQGSGQLQLACQVDPAAAMGGGISSIGKDMRQAIKEVIKVSGVDWQGLEMPTSAMSNVSGFNPQQGGFSEQKRQTDQRHIKDAIQFAAEIGAGGGVDIWSQEFFRGIHNAGFNKDGTFVDFDGFDENRDATMYLVDKRTGKIQQFSAQQIPQIAVPEWETAQNNYVDRNGVMVQQGDYIDELGNKLTPDINNSEFISSRVPKWDPETKSFKTKQMDWTEFKTYAQERNQKEFSNPKEYLSPEEWFYRIQLEEQISQAKVQKLQHYTSYEKQSKQLKELFSHLDETSRLEEGRSQEELMSMGLLVPKQGLSGGYEKKSEVLKEQIDQIKNHLEFYRGVTSQADSQINLLLESMNNITTMDKYGKEKTFDSYSDLGIYALEQTKQHNPTRPIHVGPELGWPQAYGGHTDEFIETINESRVKMVEKLKQNPAYRSKYTDTQMQELAKKHIGGVLDTSHLSMWYNHFPKQHENEAEESRLKRFNKWYIEQMEKLGKSGTVASVQAVNSMTGQHRHLPVDQGIFPVVDALNKLKESGFEGEIISEGHEEDSMEAGRNQYSIWNAFGANIGSSGYFGGVSGGNTFGNVYSGAGGAAGYRAPPNYIVGAYNPSNDWQLWSEVKLE
jgi:hypothetical protein